MQPAPWSHPLMAKPIAPTVGECCFKSANPSTGSHLCYDLAMPGLVALALTCRSRQHPALCRVRFRGGWRRHARPSAPEASRNIAADDVCRDLCKACREGQTRAAMQLMQDWPEEVRAAISGPAADGKLSPLAWAASRNLTEVVQYMVDNFREESRASLNHTLFTAVRYGLTDIVELLIQAYPGPARTSARRDLSEACRAGHTRIANLLMKTFPVEARASAREALNEACCHGNAGISVKLLEDFPEEARNALCKGDRHGSTPMHGACKSGIIRVVRRLLETFPLEAAAALELEDQQGWTPSMWALESGHDEVVQLLLDKFPDSVAQAAPLDDIEEDDLDLPRMLTSKAKEDMERTGYRMVGSHSAVKQCRWTRNALLGQGQCYKHTFYGISSHQCMEATPSLACANKCTFCWRNHVNPVATSWEFQTDDPEWIVQESVRNHLELVEETARSPVAIPERILEARSVRHTALSLVGEPVLYPKVAQFIASLHRRRISTFLVTNGQFPEQLEALPWVTQLYVSLDAPDSDSAKEIGRPLFKDYWERLRRSLIVLRDKKPKQRTVCRLTVLQGQCLTDEACNGYAELIELSECDFVEVKGGTFAPVWEKKNSGLTRTSIPRHADVKAFAERLAAKLPAYGVACEHEHSFGILLARRDRFFDPWRRWHTWINYDRFANAAEVGQTLEVSDFVEETPDWALAHGLHKARIGDNAGFDPEENRRFRKMPKNK
eukprot:TRINITY_DN47476_c0_g1_i1.p1 TRINITY_DN47476_c0_g1~~TRINITY_DN47476_c0_g1_i1.p1  ORF type:complete len:735 (-),score=106.95 TRINITY_DN47476_c0_g1_i1:46-2220(-)